MHAGVVQGMIGVSEWDKALGLLATFKRTKAFAKMVSFLLLLLATLLCFCLRCVTFLLGCRPSTPGRPQAQDFGVSQGFGAQASGRAQRVLLCPFAFRCQPSVPIQSAKAIVSPILWGSPTPPTPHPLIPRRLQVFLSMACFSSCPAFLLDMYNKYSVLCCTSSGVRNTLHSWPFLGVLGRFSGVLGRFESGHSRAYFGRFLDVFWTFSGRKRPEFVFFCRFRPDFFSQ